MTTTSPRQLDEQDAADAAWADPEWSVDSAIRTCCGGIGRHSRGCMVEMTTQGTDHVVPPADSAAMTTALADPAPPTAAHDVAEWWEADDGRRFRCIENANRVAGTNKLRVYAHCIQWDNGEIHQGDGGGLNRPVIALDEPDEDGCWRETGVKLTAAEAREAAAILLQAADELDGWVK